MIWETNKYKDEYPIKTIQKARNILSNLNLVPIEIQWENSVKNYYSVSLKIENTSIRSNGKGTSAIYALASAYGEMMERLQNFAPFRLGMDFSSDAIRYNDFYYAPDEKEVYIKDLLSGKNEWINLQLKYLKNGEELLKLWKQVTYEDISKDFITLPYINLNTENISFIPAKMVCKMYMSNGMSAGNTPEEALIQGISEIFERYVNAKIINEKITPPDIPRAYLENYPIIIKMIGEIENSGQFRVIVKDCSLGLEYPVVCVILIDISSNRYYVKFGSFPKLNIAIERTLTEMLQGQELTKMKSMTEFSYSKQIIDQHENLLSIFVNGIGIYPVELFYDKPNYRFKPIKRFDGKNSKQLFSQVFNFIKEQGYSVFIRDVSFLKFPAYHVIIPSLSEIQNIYDKEIIDMYKRFNKAKILIRNLHDLNDEKIKELIEVLDYNKYHPLMPIADFLRLDISKSVPWYLSNISFLRTALNCKVKNYINAEKAFSQFMQCVENNNQGILPYYKCVKNYLEMKADNKSDDVIKILLNKIYQEGMIDTIVTEFSSNNIFKSDINIFNCFKCEKCDLRYNCNYKNNEKIYKLLKKEYGANKTNLKIHSI